MSKYPFTNFFTMYTAIASGLVGLFCLYAGLYLYGVLLLAASAALIAFDRWTKKQWPGAFGGKNETKPKS